MKHQKLIERLDLNTTPKGQLKAAVRHIERGIERIRTKGWCQGELEDPSSGEVCALGAMGFRHYSDAKPAQTAAAKLVVVGIKEVQPKAKLEKFWHSNDIEVKDTVTGWNDKKGRRKQDVLKAFRRAVKIGNSLIEARG